MYAFYERPELKQVNVWLAFVGRMFGEGILLVLFLVQKHSSASQRKRAARLGRTAL